MTCHIIDTPWGTGSYSTSFERSQIWYLWAKGLSYGSTSSICHDTSKNCNLLHTWTFVESQLVATVILDRKIFWPLKLWFSSKSFLAVSSKMIVLFLLYHTLKLVMLTKVYRHVDLAEIKNIMNPFHYSDGWLNSKKLKGKA